MSLLFESVSLRNFGPYRHVENLPLSTNPESPVVIIHGENTLGKTSLFRALRWCLYGAPEAGMSAARATRELSGYMNRPARVSGESEMQVSITFRAHGQRYQLTRSARVEGDSAPRASVDLRIDSAAVQQAAVDAEIGRLLHPQISEFFLFDGELLRDFYDRLNSASERDLLRSSIESVLGIPALQLAHRDVATMRDDVLQRQAKEIKKQKDADAARRQLRELKSRQESLAKDRAEVSETLRKTQQALEDVKERIAAVDDLKADAREMQTLEALIQGDADEEQKIREEMRSLLVSGWLAPVRPRLSKILQDIQSKNDLAQARQKEIRAAQDRVHFLRERIDGGRCPTCEQELPAADADTIAALKSAEAELAELARGSSEGPDLQLERRIQALIDERTADSYRDRQRRLNAILTAQYDRGRRLAAVKDRLRDNDAAAIRQLGNEQDRLERAIPMLRGRLRKLDADENEVGQQQNKLAGVLRRLGGGQPELAAQTYFFEYVSDLLAGTIDRYQERTRLEVEATATEMFKKLIRDPGSYDGISIGTDYRVDLVGRSGPSMKTSEGGRQLIALSLIGALKRAAVRGGPVVLDSPLARLDLEHRQNVLNAWVPELGSQAVLLVQSGELTERQAREIMGSRIGHAYRIVRPHGNPEEAVIERTH